MRHRDSFIFSPNFKKLDYKGRPSELNQYSNILIEYLKEHPPSTVAEASDAIEKITGIKRSPTQVRDFLKREGLRCLKVGHVQRIVWR
ncbi:hypothetical protein CAL7716_061930 [Calothrix sp. PCC 7716]|nr:hypothetical protein CAL7716_061930 [Calothrix sp. PCC 7716]